MRYSVTSILAIATLACGCGTKPPAIKETIPLSELSPELLKVAQQTLPGVKFDTVMKTTYNGKPVFEIRGKMPNGKVREVEVSPEGEVVEIE
jgi:hypothetical protein